MFTHVHFSTFPNNVLIAGGEHEDGDRVVLRTQAAADFEAIQFGQHHVEHHKRRLQAGDGFQGGFAVAGGFDAEVLALQVHAAELDDGGFVVYKED
jgi:hypothetical protein